MSRIKFVDCDSHVTEAPDLWTSRVAKKWGDLVPHVEWVENPSYQWAATRQSKVGRYEMWMVGDTPIVEAAGSARGAWPEPPPAGPRCLAEAHPAAYDAKARLETLDERGIAAQVLYPNLAGFGARPFRTMPLELAVECVQAYNDFLIEEWAAVSPRRLIPVAALPYWDPDACVAEVERAASLGFPAIVFPGGPHNFELPFFASKYWDPVWTAIQDAAMSVSLHAGAGNFDGGMSVEQIEVEGFPGAWTRASTQILFQTAGQVTDLVMSGILPRFPGLTFVSVESGIGWVPFMLESLDYQFQYLSVAKSRPEFEAPPSEYFHRQVKVCYWFEQAGPQRLLDDIGVDNILFETDFPHPMCLNDEQIRDAVEHGLAPLSQDARDKILFKNAAVLYRLGDDVLDLV